MIVQLLAHYYDAMLKRGAISAPGWGPASISYAICLDLDGNVLRLISTVQEVAIGNKTKIKPQIMTVPLKLRHTADITANFLWDDSRYILGVGKDGEDNEKKAKKNIERFKVAAKFHHDVLKDVDSPAARAILKYFDKWKPENAKDAEALQDIYDDVINNANITFRVDGEFAYDDEQIRAAWQRRQEGSGDYAKMQCLVTGRKDEIPKTHPLISGVKGAQTGAALVSFNKPAFCSYGHEQNMNAPIGKHAAFAYTTALNYLLADKNNVQYIGDMTVVCWAEDADERYQAMGISALFGNAEAHGQTADAVRAVLKNMARGLPSDDFEPSHKFYVLGLALNKGRLSVRVFMQCTFGTFMKNINDHYERLEIVRPGWVNDTKILSLWKMVMATVRRTKSKNAAMTGTLKRNESEVGRDADNSDLSKAMSDKGINVMVGATMRAILNGTYYPASLLESVMMRIRAERDITWQRAAILKAYYLKNEHVDCPKEVLTVSLNEASTNPAYTLGRLFAIYEKVQIESVKANGNKDAKLNATIKDKYFNSASAMPSSIFPILNNLYQKHLRKLSEGSRRCYNDQVVALNGVLGEGYPQRMTLAQQGSFILGYYHQVQKLYEKRNKEED